jgi:hypothetical protein
MKNAAITTVDDYIAGFPPPVRKLISCGKRSKLLHQSRRADQLPDAGLQIQGVLVYLLLLKNILAFYATYRS